MPFTGYRQTSGYGYRKHPISGKRLFHSGIDLVYKHKAPIKAFAAGKVIYAGMGQSGSGLGGYGNVVLIEDKNGYGQLYAHLDSVQVKSGDNIQKGQTIGRQGATGNVTGSHLHFEIRKNISPSYGWSSDKENSTVNPTNYLKEFNRSTSSSKWKKVTGNWTGQTLRKGQHGKPVKQLQTMLAENNPPFYPEKGAKNNGIDSYFGDKTANATERFQSYYGLTVDGLAGTQTFNKLNDLKKEKIKVGSKVKIKSSATKYATGQNIPARYKGKSYTVQQIKGDRVLIKELYSWVYKKDIS